MSERRGSDRRRSDRRGPPEDSRALVPVTAAKADKPDKPDKAGPAEPRPDPAFEAQRLGQPGVKRGLKGGQEVLDQARSTYLRSEYSGSAERRPAPGKTTKTEI
ncbi:hypothetical protein [Brevundimonas sp.]|uniref:hypothetical protein n=1 Tax=Brevundimonas sp. TaxID=1871086 RepID=UPI0025D79A62|nr:hypothetical protein [Brevundimonas sp.]